MLVKSRMTQDVVSVRPETEILEALQILEKHHYEGLPVVDEQGKIVGIITEKDILRSFVATRAKLEGFEHIPFADWAVELDDERGEFGCFLRQARVKDVMTSMPILVSEGELIEVAARFMKKSSVSVLPVVNKNMQVVGIISEADIYDVMMETFGYTRQGVRITVVADDTVGRLAGITNALKKAGVNIISLTTTGARVVKQGQVIIKVAKDDGDAAVSALRKQGFQILRVDSV